MNKDLDYKRINARLPSIKSDIQVHCWNPWQMINIDKQGRVFICWCDGHLPYPVGHVTDFDSLYDVFNNPEALKIQSTINDRTYQYCNTQSCSMVLEQLPYVSIYLGIDNSCNLSCPSCRESMIYDKSDSWIAERNTWIDTVAGWIKTTEVPVRIGMGADGDPFASRVYRHALEVFQHYPQVEFELSTNGILLQKNLETLDPGILKRIQRITVSIDSPYEETYEQLRRGARFGYLMDNLDYLQQLIKKYQFEANGHMIVQSANLDQVYTFIDFCESYSLQPQFTVLEDWGTWHDYSKHCVHLPGSDRLSDFVKIFSDPIFAEKEIDLSRIKPWL